MIAHKFKYSESSGWSVSGYPAVDSDKTAIFVFGAPELMSQDTVFSELFKAYPKSKVIGCGGAGEIFGAEVNDRSLSVAVVQFEHTDLAIETVEIDSPTQSASVGEALGKKLNRPGLCGIFTIADGLKVNGSALVKGLVNQVSKNVIITGGLAGDGPRFEKTWVLRDRKPAVSVVSALGFYGNRLEIHHGSRGGWDIFGPERIVTRSHENILFELDGKPALSLYKEYLGDRARELPASGLLFPLQIRASKEDESYRVRTILAVDEKNQSMTFAGDIPQGSIAQLMRANFERIIEGASQAAESAISGIKTQSPKSLTLAVSCVGRRLVLGERIEEEVEAILEKLPPGSEQVGFYSYGEISPLVKGGPCLLHNQTMTLTTLIER